VNGVGTGLGLDEDGTARGAAKLRRVSRGDHLEFLHRVRAGNHVCVVVAIARHFDAIDLNRIGELTLPVDRQVQVVAPAARAHAGNQQHQAGKVAAIQRKVFDLARADHLAGFRALHLKNGGRTGYLDIRTDRANLHWDIEARLLIDAEFKCSDCCSGKAVHFHTDRIVIRRQRREVELPSLVCRRRCNDAGVNVLDGDMRSLHHFALRVSDATGDGASGGLSKAGDGRDRQASDQCNKKNGTR
jgi:hypothetical protein